MKKIITTKAAAGEAAGEPVAGDLAGDLAGDPAGADSLLGDNSGLEVASLSVCFADGFLALDSIDLRVKPGEVVALQGESGSGKSTLLRAIAGLQKLSGGVVSWNGADLARVAPHKRGFGLMFQSAELFGHLNVGQNVAYGMRVQKFEKSEIKQRTAELLELVGLGDYADRPVATLSGGQAQRVALARALAPRPKLLMLDEPLSALDTDLRQKLAVDLAKILRQTKTTAILVTHDSREASVIADRTQNMSAGRLV